VPDPDHRLENLVEPFTEPRVTMFGLKEKRREKIRKEPFPPEWLETVRKNVPYFARLSEGDGEELQGHIQVFIREKNFEGCGGLELTDEIRVTVAAQACILLLHRKTDYYPPLKSILVYPHPYVARGVRRNQEGILVVQDEARAGESWGMGTLVLSWEDVKKSAADIHDGHNVVLHEFAHQLDEEDGAADGAPRLRKRSMYVAWARVLSREYEQLLQDIEHHRRNIIAAYGATNPAEFFAVVTECFFDKPVQLKKKHPELYKQLMLFYRQDPEALVRLAKAHPVPRGGRA
jgi:Mlc titration factor MtfA (ptsG expression regulator)